VCRTSHADGSKKNEEAQLMYGRWKEFCRFWDELGVPHLLGKHTPNEICTCWTGWSG
jgi:hypothetical protein